MTKIYKKKKIVCIGGGTGTFIVLKGLKKYPYDISAIVTMSDSGGSNKRIRDEFGLLPTSDIRQCFVALSEENSGAGLLRKLFMYRFEKGKGISGMTFGNLFMAALSDIVGSQEDAIRQTGKVLKIHGNVIPVSYTDTNLVAEYEDNSMLYEEHSIDEPKHDGKLRIKNIYLQPNAKANPEALFAIRQADCIIMGPGDLYTSIVPNFLVQGISKAIQKSNSCKVYIMNLMTKYGQTYNFSAKNHLQILEQYLDRSIQYVVVNSAQIPKEALNLYAKYHEQPVIDDLPRNSYFKVIKRPIISGKIIKKSSSDKLIRSLIRHNSILLAQVLSRIIELHT